MTGEEKMLATALRDLCGWHVGMVLTDAADDDLPALDSPANWGHWLAWAFDHGFAGVLYECRLGYVFDFGCKAEDGIREGGQPSFAHGFMVAVCTYHDEVDRSERLPPSVLAWWKEHGQ